MRSILNQKLLWIAAFGYFVDLYDLVLYGAVRVESLTALGVPANEQFSIGTRLLNFQMGGMLAGGFFFGILGDRKGRKSALFGSILLYSLATFFNADVRDIATYELIRFIAGFGLAGELGAAITLVGEVLPQDRRGLGSTLIAAVGFLGAVASSFISQKLHWQTAYRLGGSLGLLLLVARMSVTESRVFLAGRAERPDRSWGSLRHLFRSWTRVRKLFLALLIGVPIWYVAGILSYFAPEFATELKIKGQVTAGTTIMMGYLGAILGDIACGFLSQTLKSRKKAILIFLCFGASLALLHPLFSEGTGSETFYWIRFGIGFGNGYSALLVAWVSELFGTNLRTLAANLVSNLMRAAVIPISFAFGLLRPSLGLLESHALLGTLCFMMAFGAMLFIPDSFDQSLEYFEP